jgi:hypothetical protein
MMPNQYNNNIPQFIGKHTDEESRLADHGVRKYNKVMGHELLENFLRTDYRLYYDKAHGGANILFFGGTDEKPILFREIKGE